MPVVKMQKVALLAHKSLQEDILEFLQDEGVMEVSPNEGTEDTDHPKVLFEEAEVLFAIDFLRPSATKEIQKEIKQRASVAETKHSALHTDFRSIIDECKELEDQQSEVRTESQNIEAERAALLPWKELPFKLNERETETSALILGTCSAGNREVLQKETARALPRTEWTHVEDNAGQSYLAAIVWKEDRDAFERLIARYGWTEAQLPHVERVPVQELKRIDQSFRVIEGKETEIAQKKAELAKSLPDLVRLSQFLHWMDEKQSVRSGLAETKQTVKLTGWIPQKDLAALEEKLEGAFQGVALLQIEPNENEEPPMQIKNMNAIAPFEAVTRLYGLPQGSEMDPTRPLMPFFILYFGLCLTDAGYGAVLALLMGLAIWKFKLKRQEQKLIWLLFYAGIVTFIVSIPFGGWFGMTPDQAPGIMTKMTEHGVRFKGQIWDLNKDVDFFQNLALSLGAIQLLFGIFLAGYWKWIHGQKLEAFLTHFTAHLFVATLAARYLLNLPDLQYLLYGIGLLFVWGQGSGKWFVRPLIGVLGTINFLIGMMSNILSYLRILALGLATGALAFAINQIAAVIADLLPGLLGIPVFILILLGGHMISIALNGLGSFVHSGRLQFIEFFGQFFQGGGREFAPFRRTSHSII